jgi:hypothetical protein
MMKVAFLHYHLKTGGVTTVLKQQLDAMASQGETIVLTGLPPNKPFPAEIGLIPELAYTSEYTYKFDPHDVAQKILKFIDLKFGGPCDIIHVHNPTLAKNRQFLKILKALQKRGANLLLQIHDFAEDGRPFAYFAEDYPADCHYAVINKRDYEILCHAGLKKDGLHLIENAVDHRPVIPTGGPPKPLRLYPIRAIRRKNIGEAILLSLFFNIGETLAITLPPNSVPDIKSYNNWKTYVRDQNLKVAFDTGLKHDFETNVMSADSLITTSITEGFGFSFLEPWLFGKLLWGRKLPDICRDFEKKGVQLKHLYTRLLVPVDWIDLHQFRENWKNCVHNAWEMFNFAADRALIKKGFERIIKDGVIDFGLLDEKSQKNVLSNLIAGRKNPSRLIQLNPFLVNPGQVSDKNRLISDNQAAIEQSYNHAQYGQKLRGVYDWVSKTEVNQCIDKNVLVSAFLDLKEFSLLKWSDPT